MLFYLLALTGGFSIIEYVIYGLWCFIKYAHLLGLLYIMLKRLFANFTLLFLYLFIIDYIGYFILLILISFYWNVINYLVNGIAAHATLNHYIA